MSALAARQRADGSSLRWLADAYARYAHLVHAQLEALDHGDLDRLASLAAERDALASEIDGRRDGAAGTGPDADRLLAEVRSSLRHAAEADGTLRSKLRELRGDAQDAIRAAEQSSERALAVARGYAPTAPPGTRLDITF